MKVAGFEKEELCEIMDATLCCLVTWLEGHSTAQVRGVVLDSIAGDFQKKNGRIGFSGKS